MTLFLDDGDVRLYLGDALETVREMPDESVDCVVTSPPYWGLRDYGTGEWDGGDPDCDHAKHNARKPHERKTSTLGGGTDTIRVQEEANVFRDVCGKCGARRVDRQMGLEPTPDLFVAGMVELFREIRRVLAPHGTCWVNLGDSYTQGPAGRRDHGVEGSGSRLGPNRDGLPGGTAIPASPNRAVPVGLKPKDLVGIPWAVAKALQQPYYTGRIKDVNDRFWLAAMVDAEGCIHVHRRKAGASAHSTFEKADGTVSEYVRKQDTYGVMVSIDNTSKAIIDRCHAIIGQGSRYTQEAGTGKQQRKQAIHRLTLTGNQSRELLRELYPYLVAKQREARIAYHSPSNGPEAEAAHGAIKALHNGLDTTVDRPAPPTLFEPGWYLRSDVIWGKSNPMPESVTDRPTKAHEYVFLLTKQPRYYYDGESIREPHTWGKEQKRLTPKGDRGDQRTWTPPRHEFVNPAGRNSRSVWQIATQPYREAHFATYPEELARRCILAGCPVRVCRVCGKPSERIVKTDNKWTHDGQDVRGFPVQGRTGNPQSSKSLHRNGGGVYSTAQTVGWSDCGHNNWRPGTVLDPFIGSGTTAKVARDHQRHAIGIDLNREYLELAARRLQQLSLLT